jgi:hypothetical protein
MDTNKILHRNIKNYFNEKTKFKKFTKDMIIIGCDKYIKTNMDIIKLASIITEFDGV